MGGGDEGEEEQKKLQNLGFEASNPKRKKDLPQTLKFFRPNMGNASRFID
jgi:hypothetical protein